MSNSIESLTLLPLKLWPSLVNIFKGRSGLTARTALKSQLIQKEKYPDFPVKLYAPYNDPEEGIVFIWNLNETGPELLILSTKDDQSKLVQAIINSKEIGQFQRLLFCAVLPNIENTVDILAENYRLCDKIADPTYVAHVSREKALQYDTTPLPNTRLEIIGPEYADEINNAWPYKYPGSLGYFQLMLKHKAAIAIIGEPEGDLRGWVLRSVRGDLHALHVKTEHRRKGYAQYLVKTLSKKIAEQDIEVFACIVIENTASKEMFLKLGFEFINTVKWIHGCVE